jgi:DNA-binding MarR family transcriptional regulator
MAHPAGLPFGEIKELCGLTDGNLSCHLRVVEDAGLVDMSRGSEFNRPQTVYRMSPAGRKRYLDYLAILEQVLLDAAAAVKVNADSINADRKGVRAPARG